MNGRDRSGSVLAIALVCALTVPASARGQAADFTIVAVPDTQYYACQPGPYGPMCAVSRGIYERQTEWIADERDRRHIEFVAGLGDCVENADLRTEFGVASAAWSVLENATNADFPDGIPYGVAVGNHDQYPLGDPGEIAGVGDVLDRDQGATTELFNEVFGVDRFCPQGECRSYYGGHFGTNNDNHYDLFEANGYAFVVVSLEYMPGDTDLRVAVLDWADDVLTMWSDRLAIVVSHYVMDQGTGGPFSSQGEALYDALKAHPNLILILGGHMPGEGRRTDVFDGHTVHTVLADYQGRNNGGDGWLRLLEFQPASDRIAVETYSPYRRRYETDDSSEFTLAVDLDGGFPDATASFQQGVDGYTGAADTWLDDLSGPHDPDARLTWDADEGKGALLRFGALFEAEGGPIPAGAEIRSAVLHYVADDAGDDANVHELLAPWLESVTQATFGPTPGAQPGEDYDPDPIGLASGSARHDHRAHTVDVTTSVAAWAADPSANHGWIFVPTGPAGARVRSGDHADRRDRPRLSVAYVPCATGADCDDLGVCTADTCVDGSCRHEEIERCPLDTDRDGREDYLEVLTGTDPLRPDTDGDGISDPLDPCAAGTDTDADQVCDALDGCPVDADPSQADADRDRVGDVCDACPTADPGQGAWFAAGRRLDLTPADLAAGDLDADGADELVADDGGVVWVLWSLGGRSALSSGPEGPHRVGLTDLDLDGAPDVVAARVGDGEISAFVGPGLAPLGVLGHAPSPSDLVALDLDADGHEDLALGTGGEIVIATWSASAPWTIEPAHPIGPDPLVAAADLDGDGLRDLVVASADGLVWWDASCVERPLAAVDPVALEPGDLDGDAVSELVVVEADGTVTARWADGRSTVVATDGVAVAVADLDRDGDRDLALATPTGLLVFTNDGSGAFAGPTTVWPTPTARVWVAELDGVGGPDLVATAAADGAAFGLRNGWPVSDLDQDGACDAADDDADGDGASASVDCDDLDPTRSPGATEVAGDGIDQDCDGQDGIPATDLGAATDTGAPAGQTGAPTDTGAPEGFGPAIPPPRTAPVQGGCSSRGAGGVVPWAAVVSLLVRRRRVRAGSSGEGSGR